MVLSRARLAALCAALLLALTSVARAAPAVNTWEYQTTRIWPPSTSSASADTLTRVIAATDSIAVTDSVNVNGARLVLLFVQGDATDTLAVPILQTRLPNGQWSGAGNAFAIPPTGGTQTKPLAATTPVTSQVQFAWGIYSEVSSGGTPVPFGNDYFRWRIKSNDQRRYATPSSATLAATGNITIRVLVCK